MGQQYSFTLKVLQDHALVLRDLAVLNHEGLKGISIMAANSTLVLWNSRN